MPYRCRTQEGSVHEVSLMRPMQPKIFNGYGTGMAVARGAPSGRLA